MKCRWWIVLGSAGVAMIASILVMSVFFNDPISEENFAMIQKGMAEADVVHLLGRPADEAWLLQMVDCECDPAGVPVDVTRKLPCKAWYGRRKKNGLIFQENGRVRDSCLAEAEPFSKRIRNWLHADRSLKHSGGP